MTIHLINTRARFGLILVSFFLGTNHFSKIIFKFPTQIAYLGSVQLINQKQSTPIGNQIFVMF